MIAQENTELASAFIQKTAVERAIPEMDKRLATVSSTIYPLSNNEGRRGEKTDLWGFQPGLTQTRPVQSQEKACTIREAKIKVLISCAVTAQLICRFAFAYVKNLVFFSRNSMQIRLIKAILFLFNGTPTAKVIWRLNIPPKTGEAADVTY